MLSAVKSKLAVHGKARALWSLGLMLLLLSSVIVLGAMTFVTYRSVVTLKAGNE